MKIIVIGAGVIGVSAAYELAREGHRVIVIDRQTNVASETSFANAGEISPGYSAPWSAPGMPLKALGWMLKPDSPLIIELSKDRKMASWLVKALGNCNAKSYMDNKAKMVALAEYSRDALREISKRHHIAYQQRNLGTLELLRTPKQTQGVQKDMQILSELGVPHKLLDRQGITVQEPALAGLVDQFDSGLWLPKDDTGDCQIYTTKLAEIAKKLGVRFQMKTTVASISVAGGKVCGVMLAHGKSMTADAVVVAAGSYTPLMIQRHGPTLPIYPVKGYSITVDIDNEIMAPRSTVMDEKYKVAITRLGERIRVGGTAQLSGFDLSLPPERKQLLQKVVSNLYGQAFTPAALDHCHFWTGLRPMTPDGPPVIGQLNAQGLWVASGHGTLGWTMAAGTAKILSDLMCSKTPALNPVDYSPRRYKS